MLDRVPERGWLPLRAAAWAVVAGNDVELETASSGPYAAMIQRDWAGAADAFGAVGWEYDRALMLSLLDDEASLAEAIEIARRLGAEPLTKRRRGAHARARIPRAGRASRERPAPILPG